METRNMDTHKLIMDDRKHIEVWAVKEVSSFDTEEILLDTKLGRLLIKGHEMHINSLDLEKGIVDVDGKINALIYSNKGKTDSSFKGIMARLFR